MRYSGVLGLIPARAGSKELPGKNYRSLLGKPLIQWTIEAALDSIQVDDVVVSSDDKRILHLALEFGVNVHKRPSMLSGDSVRASEVIEDVLSTFSSHQTLVLLQPTSPLRTGSHISEAIQLFYEDRQFPVVSVMEVSQHPEWIYCLNSNKRLISYMSSPEQRRQDTEKRFIPNGAIYIADTTFLRERKFSFSGFELTPYLMDQQTSIDIDNIFDFELAEWVMSKTNSSANE